MKKRGTVCGGVCVLSNISSRDSSAQNWPGEGRGCLIGKGWVGEIDWQEEVEGGDMGLMSVQGRRGLDAASLPATSTADHFWSPLRPTTSIFSILEFVLEVLPLALKSTFL